jgi:hypothetical protein
VLDHHRASSSRRGRTHRALMAGCTAGISPSGRCVIASRGLAGVAATDLSRPGRTRMSSRGPGGRSSQLRPVETRRPGAGGDPQSAVRRCDGPPKALHRPTATAFRPTLDIRALANERESGCRAVVDAGEGSRWVECHPVCNEPRGRIPQIELANCREARTATLLQGADVVGESQWRSERRIVFPAPKVSGGFRAARSAVCL